MDSQKRWVLAAVDVYFRDHMGLLLVHCLYMKTQGVEQNNLRFLIFNLFKDFLKIYLKGRWTIENERDTQRESDLLSDDSLLKLATTIRVHSSRNQHNRNLLRFSMLMIGA